MPKSKAVPGTLWSAPTPNRRETVKIIRIAARRANQPATLALTLNNRATGYQHKERPGALETMVTYAKKEYGAMPAPARRR